MKGLVNKNWQRETQSKREDGKPKEREGGQTEKQREGAKQRKIKRKKTLIEDKWKVKQGFKCKEREWEKELTVT